MLLVAGAIGLAAVRWDNRGNLGRIASCTNRRIYIRDDLERGAAHPASLCRHETLVEHETHVWRIGTLTLGCTLRVSCEGHRVTRELRELGVVGLAWVSAFVRSSRVLTTMPINNSRNFNV